MSTPDHYSDILSYEGVTKKLARKLDIAEETLCDDILQHRWVLKTIAYFDTLKFKGGNGQTYSRGLLIAFFIIALATGKNLVEARDFVQASRKLRARLGLPPPTDEIIEKLEGLEHAGEDIAEKGFPTRQLINSIPAWLEDYFMRMMIEDGLAPVREITYVDLPLEIITEFEIRITRGGVDGTRCASPNRYKSRRREDPGASYQKDCFGRWKMTVVGGDVPIALASVVSRDSDGQVTLAQRDLIPQLETNIELMRQKAGKDGSKKRRKLESLLAPHIALAGDGVFNCNSVVKATWDAGFLPCYRQANQLSRKLVGYRRATKKHSNKVHWFAQSDDGCLYCPCTAGIEDLSKRPPMRQHTHKATPDGKVAVRCDRKCSEANGETFYVSFGGPTHDLDKKPVRERTSVGVGPVWKGDLRTAAIIHKVENAIEHYHCMQRVSALMGAQENDKGRRKIWGNFANDLWWLLADLVWNIRIQLNLRELKRLKRPLKSLPWRRQFGSVVRMWRDVTDRKDGKTDIPHRRDRRGKSRGDPLFCPVFFGGEWIYDDEPNPVVA